jgi:hypothetical protein
MHKAVPTGTAFFVDVLGNAWAERRMVRPFRLGLKRCCCCDGAAPQLSWSAQAPLS